MIPGALDSKLLSRRARMIVHDLRNPLSVIRGYLQVMAREIGDGSFRHPWSKAGGTTPGLDGDSTRRPRSEAEGMAGENGGGSAEAQSQAEYLEGALAATTELDEMIQSMLDLAVVEEAAFEPKRIAVDAVELLRRVEKRLGPWIGQETRDLAVKSAAGLPALAADPVYVERAVKNLVMHAVRRSPVGAKVVLSCEGRNGRVIFSVRDKGPVVPASSGEHYFDGSSAEEHRELGWKADRAFALACVKKVAEGHGGSVGVESDAEGTTFFFILPANGGEHGTGRD